MELNHYSLNLCFQMILPRPLNQIREKKIDGWIKADLYN